MLKQNITDMYPRSNESPLRKGLNPNLLMKKTEFSIYHPENGELNPFVTDEFKYEEVFCLFADNLYDVFKNCQNDFNPLYRSRNIRSTSVGDIIHNRLTDTYYFIAGKGLTRIPKETVTKVINIPNPISNETIADFINSFHIQL